ncbi:hypothetical protein GBF38_021966 [Nibea albiflora]|uniref:Uncharacterized protein n=1 Tax=Nibea albiflora TaxID=240163 RepID=A0ACB7FGI6_NIBAL|nr:hypothetical protein GBF38_021966 [Nibea albiflora]
MDPEDSDYEEKQEFPLATVDTIRPLVQLFLVQLTTAQWANLGSGAVDKHTEKIITEMCVDLVNTMSTRIFHLYRTHVDPRKSTQSVSEEEVQQFLGDSITETFEFVTGGEVPIKSAERVTEIVTREITERINSQLSNDSKGSKVNVLQTAKSYKFINRVKIMVKHVARMLKRCGTTVAHATGVQAAVSQSQETAGTSQSFQGISQISAASLVPEEVASETMDPENEDREFPQVTRDMLRPLVDLFLSRLTAEQWASVGSGELDEKTEKIITEMCADLVNAISAQIFQLFKTHLAPLGSKELISEEEVQMFLGDSITETFESVTGREVPSKSAERVTEIVTREITERINSQLFNSSEGSKVSEPQATESSRFTRRLRSIVKHVTRMLKNCRGKVAWANGLQETPAASLVPEEVATQGPVEVSDQGLVQEPEDIVAQALEEFDAQEVAAPGPEETATAESFMTKTTETVMKILSEQASHIDVEYNANISLEEHMEIMSSIIEDTNETASDIASFIWSNKEAFGLHSDGSPRSVSSSSSINCWDILANKIKTFFARKFTKEAVVIFIAKIRHMLSCVSTKKTSLDVLVPAATEVVQAIIPPDNQEMCIYKEMASCMENEFTGEGPEEQAPPSTTPEPDVNNEEEDIPVTPTNESKPPSITAEPYVSDDEEDIPVTPTNESKPPSITAEPYVSDDKEDISVTPTNESKPLSITAKTEVSDDEEDELIDEEDDTAEVVPPNVTAEPAISGSAKQSQPTEPEDLKNLFYVSMVSAVLNQIFKNSSFHITLSSKNITDISSALVLMLHTKLAGSDFVKPSCDKIKNIARAVYKELCKKMGSKGVVAMNLLSKDSLMYECVTETIKRHLMKPKKTGVKGFFNSFFKIVCKPFKAIFTHS